MTKLLDLITLIFIKIIDGFDDCLMWVLGWYRSFCLIKWVFLCDKQICDTSNKCFNSKYYSLVCICLAHKYYNFTIFKSLWVKQIFTYLSICIRKSRHAFHCFPSELVDGLDGIAWKKLKYISNSRWRKIKS